MENALRAALFPFLDERSKRPSTTFATNQPLQASDTLAVETPQGNETSVTVTDDVQNPQFTQADTSAPLNDPNALFGGQDVRGQLDTALQAVETPNNPTAKSKGKKPRKEFKPQYENPQNQLEEAQNALQLQLFKIQNPENEDKGVKGFLKELASNFAFGLSHATPDMNLWESLALGATGGVGGMLNRSANEKRQAMRDLPQYEKSAQIAGQEQERKLAEKYKIEQTDAITAKTIRDDAELVRKIEKDAATIAYWNRKADQGDLKLANDAELMALRDKWATSKDNNDRRRLDLVEKEMERRLERTNIGIINQDIADQNKVTQKQNPGAPMQPRQQVPTAPKPLSFKSKDEFINEAKKRGLTGKALEAAITDATSKGLFR